MTIKSPVEAVDAFENLAAKVMGVADALGYKGCCCPGESDNFANMLSDVLYDQMDAIHNLGWWLNNIESVSYRETRTGTTADED